MMKANRSKIIAKTLGSLSLFLFLYSMETFLPYKLNQADREKDKSKIQTLGPFVYALDIITYLS